MADINNEGPIKNPSYKHNLSGLKNLVLVQFTQDSIVDPKQSEWFGWFDDNDHQTMLPLQNTTLYKEDWIGLRSLDEAGKLHFMSVDADHLQLGKKALDEITKKYLQ